MASEPPRWLILCRAVARKAAAQIVKCRIRVEAAVFGAEQIVTSFQRYARWTGAVWLLRFLGASVGERCNIDPRLYIQNALHGKCANLTIGQHVYIGPNCLFELADKIIIEDEVTIAAGVSITTHLDCGDRPQKVRLARRQGPVRLARGSWVSLNATVLHGVTVGEYALVAACALVREDVPANALVAGVPAQVKRLFQDELTARS